jgi:hypothetical protein
METPAAGDSGSPDSRLYASLIKMSLNWCVARFEDEQDVQANQIFLVDRHDFCNPGNDTVLLLALRIIDLTSASFQLQDPLAPSATIPLQLSIRLLSTYTSTIDTVHEFHLALRLLEVQARRSQQKGNLQTHVLPTARDIEKESNSAKGFMPAPYFSASASDNAIATLVRFISDARAGTFFEKSLGLEIKRRELVSEFGNLEDLENLRSRMIDSLKSGCVVRSVPCASLVKLTHSAQGTRTGIPCLCLCRALSDWHRCHQRALQATSPRSSIAKLLRIIRSKKRTFLSGIGGTGPLNQLPGARPSRRRLLSIRRQCQA